MANTFELYIVHTTENHADGKWSRTIWHGHYGIYSSKEAIQNDRELDQFEKYYIQTYIFDAKYGTDIYIMQPSFETGKLPLMLSNNKKEMNQTLDLCVYWEKLLHNDHTGKYYIEYKDDEYFY